MASQDSETINVLVIGPSQNGKTTFVNRLIELAEVKAELGKEGDGNTRCTNDCEIFDLVVPMTEWYLEDRKSGKRSSVPTNEAQILENSWYRKQTRNDQELRSVDGGRCPRLKLRIIDTPGLDDSDMKDYENMCAILEQLNILAKATAQWERQMHVIVFVYNANNAFSHSFQGVVRDYYRCMPNLFGQMCVVNTFFNTTTLLKKRANLLRSNTIGKDDSARAHIIKDRARDFARILGNNVKPKHFFVDNKPHQTLAYEEMVSRNTIFDILAHWAHASPMPIKQMRLVKNREMMGVDARLQQFLEKAMDKWAVQVRTATASANKEAALRATLLRQKEELTNTIQRLQDELERWDNDTRFTINTHSTKDDAGAWELVGRKMIRSRIRNKLIIKETGYDEFRVEANDSTSGRWTSKSFSGTTRSWEGCYEGVPGKVPHLVATSYTTNTVVHRDSITSWREELRRAKGSARENEDTWNLQIGQGDAVPQKDSTLDNLVVWLETAKDLSILLGKESPPLDTSFDKAARVRYRKKQSQITLRDLYAFVKAVKPDLLQPLKAVVATCDEDEGSEA